MEESDGRRVTPGDADHGEKERGGRRTEETDGAVSPAHLPHPPHPVPRLRDTDEPMDENVLFECRFPAEQDVDI